MTRRARIGIAVIAFVALIVAAVVLVVLWPRGDAPAGPRVASATALEVTDAQMSAFAEDQFEDLLARCTEPAAEVPASCGIAIPWAADLTEVTGIRYRVEQAPVLALTPPTFRADDGILVATVTGTDLDGSKKTLTYRTESWMLRGDVIVKRGGVDLEVW